MHISEDILEEIRLFANSVVLGAVLTFAYDAWVILRTVIKHRSFWISIEDLLFWGASAAITFLLLQEQNNGILRWFLVLGAGAGILLYKCSISRYYVKYASKAILYIVVYIKKTAYFVFKPLLCLKKPVKWAFSQANTGRKKVTIMLKNWLTVCIKWFTISLCKHNEENSDLHNDEEV